MSRVRVLGFSQSAEKHSVYVYLDDQVLKYDLISKDLMARFKFVSFV